MARKTKKNTVLNKKENKVETQLEPISTEIIESNSVEPISTEIIESNSVEPISTEIIESNSVEPISTEIIESNSTEAPVDSIEDKPKKKVSDLSPAEYRYYLNTGKMPK